MDEQRIYVVVAGTIQVPVVPDSHKPPLRTVIQPAGRQIAQACHVVSKLRWGAATLGGSAMLQLTFTTIILQARDSSELGHVYSLLFKKRLKPEIFSDTNSEYGPGEWPTAVAVFATKKQIKTVLDYLPPWGKHEL